jgi:hypothetical protein
MTTILGTAYRLEFFKQKVSENGSVSIIRYKEEMVLTQFGHTTKSHSLNQWMPPSYQFLWTTSCCMTKHIIVSQE